ncbi:MAG: diphthine synthase [Candidatus Terraquivivens tikiterensis]|uniref:Diphthine synthase n=1 Tax=Candidatus Terraquivivens tikiterensis TaxID=1980982 RepID=A0A2R7Y0U4_9ARCH|nr:MAG: diphthine synthase [Candidatus Terraquivivens tikiterensis]
MSITFVGLGLGPKKHITEAALDSIRRADVVFLDTYTGMLPKETVDFLRKISRRLVLADRYTLEEGAEALLRDAVEKEVVVAVQGDPFVATTHISLALEACKRGIACKTVNGISSYSAAASLSGLQAYKFGRAVTLPSEDSVESVRSVYENILENMSRGLHTLVFLDTKGNGLRIPVALSRLRELEGSLKKGVVSDDRLVVALARLGYEDCVVKAGRVVELLAWDFPDPPHMLIFPGKLHFLEREALVRLLGVPREYVEAYEPINYGVDRVRRYIDACEGALSRSRGSSREAKVTEVLRVAESYLEDSKFFLKSGDIFNSLSAISYCEGLLDALRMLGYVEFDWKK